jgi:hypothetical protein
MSCRTSCFSSKQVWPKCDYLYCTCVDLAEQFKNNRGLPVVGTLETDIKQPSEIETACKEIFALLQISICHSVEMLL